MVYLNNETVYSILNKYFRAISVNMDKSFMLRKKRKVIYRL